MSKEVQAPREDGKAKAKDEGGKEVGEEIKLHKTETNPMDKVLMKVELPASDGERGEGKRSPNLLEDINSQHLVKEKLTASGGKRGPYPGGGQSSPYLVEAMN